MSQIVPVLGELVHYGSFYEFDNGKVQGLARVIGKRLDILAVATKKESQGHLTEFLKQCMDEYTTIGIWLVWNRRLHDILLKKGFRDVTEEVLKGDGTVTGMRWDAPSRVPLEV